MRAAAGAKMLQQRRAVIPGGASGAGCARTAARAAGGARRARDAPLLLPRQLLKIVGQRLWYSRWILQILLIEQFQIGRVVCIKCRHIPLLMRQVCASLPHYDPSQRNVSTIYFKYPIFFAIVNCYSIKNRIKNNICRQLEL